MGVSTRGISDNGSGGYQPPYSRRIRLPVSLTDLTERVWVDGGLTQLPSGTKPYPEALEEEIIGELIEELNSSLALELDPAPALKRLVEKPVSVDPDPTFIIVGCRHAGKTSASLRKAGARTIEILESGWKPSSSSVQGLTSRLAGVLDKLDEASNVCVLIHLFDASYYFVRSEDGSLSRGTRSSDGRIHIEGESVLADKEGQYRAFKLLIPS